MVKPAWNWPTLTPSPLSGGVLHVWAVQLDRRTDAERRAARRHVAPSELARADRFMREMDRDRYILRHAVLREFIGHYLNCAPIDVPIRLESRGKPVLAHPDATLHFSVTQSYGVCLLAFTRVGRVGVDVEQIRDIPERMLVVQNHFSVEEQVALSTRPADEQLPAFLAAWTLKEAVLKATGEGLASLHNVEVEVHQLAARRFRHRHTETDRTPSRSWFSAALEPAPGWVGSVVVAGHVEHLEGGVSD